MLEVFVAATGAADFSVATGTSYNSIFGIENRQAQPYFIEGTTNNKLTIYFKSDATRQACIDLSFSIRNRD